MKKVLKVIGILVALTIVFVIGFLIYAKLNSGDIAAPDDSDLALVIKEIPKEQNAYYDLLSASQKLYWPEDKKDVLDKISGGEEWDDALAADILAKNKEALSFFDKASQLSEFQDPDFVNVIKNSSFDPSAPVGKFISLRNLSKLKSIESASLTKKKEFKAAALGSLGIIKVGNILENSQSASPITYLTGTAVKNIGIADFKKNMEEAKLSKFNLASFGNTLENLKVNEKDTTENILKLSYQFDKINLDAVSKEIKEASLEGIYYDISVANKISDKSSGNTFIQLITSPYLLGKYSFYYKPNETRTLIVDNYRRDIESIGNGCANISEQKTSKNYELPVKAIFIKNSVGKMFANIIDVLHPTIFNKLCDENAAIDNLISSIK